MTDRELIAAIRRAPGAQSFQPVLAKYLPFVAAAFERRLKSAESVQGLALARSLFLALAHRLRQMGARTVLSEWLFTGVGIAVKHVPTSSRRASGDPSWEFDRQLRKLRRRDRRLYLARLSGLANAEIALETGIREQKVARLLEKAEARLRGKTGTYPPPANPPLVNLASLEQEILAAVEQGMRRSPSDSAASRILSGFTWLRWKRRFAIVAGLAGACVVAIGALILSGFLLWRSGYLLSWAFELMGKRQASAMPGLAEPAREWRPSPRAALSAASLHSANDLFNATNIWEAELHFTEAQWKALEPRRIPPVHYIIAPDGHVDLRNPKAKRSGLAGSMGIEFEWTHANLDFSGIALTNVGARFKGNGTFVVSRFGPKQSFKIDFNKYVKGQSLAGLHTINLVNEIEDMSYLRDALGHELFRKAGVPASRTAYAWVRLDVEGHEAHKPLGLYLLVENVDADFVEEHFGTRKAPIFKPVTTTLFEDMGPDWSAYALAYDLKTKATPEQTQRVIDLSRLVSHASDGEFARKLPEFLDYQEFASYLAVLTLISSYDGFLSNGQNFYMYLDPKSLKFGFIPWDMDLAFGAFPFVGTVGTRERASIMHPWAHKFRFMERVMAVEGFRDFYKRRMREIFDEHFQPSKLTARIDEIVSVLREPVAAESSFRLERFEYAVGDDWREPFRGPKGQLSLKRFIAHRAESVRDQLDGKSKGLIIGHGLEKQQ